MPDIVSAENKALNINNPYQAYTEGKVLTNNSLELVVALYEGALTAGRSARLCLEAGDIWGRTKAINKAIAILTELMVSLNHEKGGELAGNLKRLYSYMQCRLIEAHTRKLAAPIQEVEGLLTTLLDGWKQAAIAELAAGTSVALESQRASAATASLGNVDEDSVSTPYGGYWNDMPELHKSVAYSF
jgi:flagellar protein FliS